MAEHNNNKKILIFSTNYFPHVGGAEMAIREICKRIPENEYFLISTKFEKGIKSFEKIDNINVYRVGFGYKFDKYIYPFISQFRAFSLMKTHKFGIVWGMMASYAGLAAWIFSKLNKKVKYLLTEQSGDSDEFIKKRTWWWNFIYKKIYKEAHHIQSISQFLSDRIRRFEYKGELTLIPNGVDIENFSKILTQEEKIQLKKELNLSDSDKIIISNSRLAIKNGLSDLINSLTYLPGNFKLIICGIGPLEENLKCQVKNLNFIDRVKFIGYVDYENLYKYLNISDVFCRPSLSEGLGNVFLESMAAKVPVVATPVGGIPDFLFDGETGLFCEVGNSKDIAEKIQKLVEDHYLRETIIRDSYIMVCDNYSWESVSDKMKVLFNEKLR